MDDQPNIHQLRCRGHAVKYNRAVANSRPDNLVPTSGQHLKEFVEVAILNDYVVAQLNRICVYCSLVRRWPSSPFSDCWNAISRAKRGTHTPGKQGLWRGSNRTHWPVTSSPYAASALIATKPLNRICTSAVCRPIIQNVREGTLQPGLACLTAVPAVDRFVKDMRIMVTQSGYSLSDGEFLLI